MLRSSAMVASSNALAQLARLAIVLGAALAAAASASSSSPSAIDRRATAAPPAQAMDPELALGLWKSSFGAVKLEYDDQGPPGAVHGVWVYEREGQQVIGYFGGALRGNVLELTWQEPGLQGPALTGAGYLVFDAHGQQFSGRWWTTARDRQGEWMGWRGEPARDDGAPADEDDPYQPPPY
jgi:hypothetical protein